MTDERLVLAELLEKAGEGDFLRAVAEGVLQLLMETDVEGLIGAGRYERSGERTTWRNVTEIARSTPGSARCNCAFRSCGKAATSRRFSKPARVRRRR
jgi:transposase-like protein